VPGVPCVPGMPTGGYPEGMPPGFEGMPPVLS